MPHLLIVEDDDDVREAYRLFFSKQGYTVRAVVCAEEAIEVISAENPDAMIVDLLLPGMDGAELCRYVRARDALKHVPIILVTCAPRGFGLDLSMIDETMAPADAVLDKMTSFEDLLDKLKEVGENHGAPTAPVTEEPVASPADLTPRRTRAATTSPRPFSFDALEDILPPGEHIAPEDVFILLGRVQDTFGRVPAGAVREISRRSGLPEARLYGALTAYRGFVVDTEEVRS